MRRIFVDFLATMISAKTADHKFTNREMESFYELVSFVILMMVYFGVYSAWSLRANAPAKVQVSISTL